MYARTHTHTHTRRQYIYTHVCVCVYMTGAEPVLKYQCLTKM